MIIFRPLTKSLRGKVAALDSFVTSFDTSKSFLILFLGMANG